MNLLPEQEPFLNFLLSNDLPTAGPERSSSVPGDAELSPATPPIQQNFAYSALPGIAGSTQASQDPMSNPLALLADASEAAQALEPY